MTEIFFLFSATIRHWKKNHLVRELTGVPMYPPMILREWHHFVQGTLRKHISDVTRKKLGLTTNFGHFSKWPPQNMRFPISRKLLHEKNQCGNGYNWRKSLVVYAYCVRKSCNLNLANKWGFILSLLTTAGSKSYEFSPNFTYYRLCMFISIVCKNKRIRLSDIGMNDTSGYQCSHASSLTQTYEL